MLLSKSTGELVFGMLACPSEARPTLTNYATYIIGVSTLAAIPLQIIWVNKGLMYFEARDHYEGTMRAGGTLAPPLVPPRAPPWAPPLALPRAPPRAPPRASPRVAAPSECISRQLGAHPVPPSIAA